MFDWKVRHPEKNSFKTKNYVKLVTLIDLVRNVLTYSSSPSLYTSVGPVVIISIFV